MDTEYIVVIALGFIVVFLGLKGTLNEIGNTSDKQFGQKSMERMITSLVMISWGLAVVLAVVVIYLVIG